jgi:signal transduction histidine kinase
LSVKKEYEIHIFRIFQEIIQNTMKHAHATSLQLMVKEQSDYLVIIALDDGNGFEVDEIKKLPGGLGLKSIESRCELINADLKLLSAKGQGCKYLIKLTR